VLIQGSGQRPGTNGVLLCAALAAGLALGALLAPHWAWPHGPRSRESAAKTPPAPPPALFPAPRASTGELRRLDIEVTAENWQILAQHRQKAIADKFLFADPAAVVPVTLRLGGETARGTARLKGDWLDHLDTEQWSLRFDLEGPLVGMRHFSIQHPKTRGYVMEWLAMKTAERLGLLSPRVEFVEAGITGRGSGVYYLEEVPAKELLERRGRLEGPVVKFEEQALWSTHMQMGFLTVGSLPSDFERAYLVFDAPTDAFGGARLKQLPNLDARLQRALRQARDLQRLAVAQDLPHEPARTLLALEQLAGRTVDDLFDTERVGQWLAVCTFYQGFHGLLWNQFRLYYDPRRDRLEPMIYDTGADLLHRPGELVVASPDARWFRSSPSALSHCYATLGRMTEPGWFDGLLQELRPELYRAARAMKAAGIEIPGFDVLDTLELLLRQQHERLRAFVRPLVPTAFSARLVGAHAPGQADERTIEVDAQATTKVPTRIDGFEFDNGQRVAPAAVLVGIAGLPDSAQFVTQLPDGAVLLPTDGRAVRFRFPANARLVGLSEVSAIKQAIRQATGMAEPKHRLHVLHRSVAVTAPERTPLVLEAVADPLRAEQGRPVAPDLWTTLAQHPWLTYDLGSGRLVAATGTHHPVGDVILPEQCTLVLPAGCEVRLQPGAALVAGALRTIGTAAAPARITAADPAQGFGILLVLGTAGPSECAHLIVSGGKELARGGWQVSGGITFLRAEATFTDCEFCDGHGEDLINLVCLPFHFTRCKFHHSPSDLFDGDFVTGEVVDCEFADSGEDAIDVSGSRVQVRNCRFTRIGDKAFSIGEGSQLSAADCHVASAMIAASSKDHSTGQIVRLSVDAVAHFMGTAYAKKPEWGPATLEFTALRWTGSGTPKYLAQTGSVLRVDGAELPAEPVDVEALYRAKILGK
jgi:hypothetical protein